MNQTGIKPVEYKVLIEVDEVSDKSDGGLFLPDSARERQEMAHDRGTLIEVGGMAFGDWKGNTPQIGDKVIFNKYAGSMIQHRQEKLTKYRLCNDKDICAILEVENE
jgi:chaperonin GroES